MMSGVPGPPPGGGNQIHLHQAQNVTSSTMLDMKTEPGHFKPEHKPDHIKMEVCRSKVSKEVSKMHFLRT